MKISIAIIMSVLCILTTTYGLVWEEYIYPRDYEYSLKLADDSSLPADKSRYLNDYLEKVKTIKGKPRYIFMTPDLELEKQIVVLEGLIQRFDDIKDISPNEMAYQQGMEQLTGQEMDHQLDRISSMFFSAKLRESGFRFFIIYFAWWILAILSIFCWVIVFWVIVFN